MKCVAPLFAIGLWACGSPPAAADGSSVDDHGAVAGEVDGGAWSSEATGRRYDDSGRPYAGGGVTLDVAERFATRTIEPPVAASPRPRSVGKRDISLRGARVDNALRMLARAGRFNLVVEDGITGTVTLELFGVEPYDAAVAVAEAHHLALHYRRGIFVVGRQQASP